MYVLLRKNLILYYCSNFFQAIFENMSFMYTFLEKKFILRLYVLYVLGELLVYYRKYFDWKFASKISILHDNSHFSINSLQLPNY